MGTGGLLDRVAGFLANLKHVLFHFLITNICSI